MDATWFKNVLGVIRTPFLTLALLCVGLAWSIACYQTGIPSFFDSLLVFMGVLASLIAVNVINEVQDFESGLDKKTHRTLFSGGSGTLVEYPEFYPYAQKIGWLAVIVALIIGVYFVDKAGIGLLLVGVAGLWIVVNYTRIIVYRPWLCLIAPGFGIGILATLACVYILSGSLSGLAVFCGLVFAVLLNALLLLNQYPDIEADSSVGRSNIWTHKGKVFGLALFRLHIYAVMALLLAAIYLDFLPLLSVVTLFTVVWVDPLLKNTSSVASLSENCVAALGKNVALCHFIPITLGLSLIISAIFR